MLTVRLRSRDGLERLQVEPSSSVLALKELVSKHIEQPLSKFVLSTDQALLTSKSPDTFLDLSDDDITLSEAGLANGTMVYCFYDGSRHIAPGYKKTAFELLPYGAHMDCAMLMAKQTRIERQDKSEVPSASFDKFAAHSFQSYISSALRFSIKRGGILYGRVDEERNVFVDAVFEPEQSGSADSLTLTRDTTQEEAAEVVAQHLGLQKVGLIFNQSSTERDYIVDNEEIRLMCQMQDEIGEHCVTAVFSQEEHEGKEEVHLEAFQCSKQAVALWKEGWFQDQDKLSGHSKLKNPNDASIAKPVMISGLDTDEIDNDFFLVAVAVKDHVGPLLTSFAVENRLTGQCNDDLKAHMQKLSTKPYSERLADFHLLLWLASSSGLGLSDIVLLADAVKTEQPVSEGYRLLIDSIAGL